jgi:hypothetical protein
MEQKFDTEMMIKRARGLAKEIRQSEAYPAIIGGIAGGIAGALMAALIASRFSQSSPSASSANEDRRGNRDAGINLREIAQFLAVVAGLIKQAREWYDKKS